MTDTQAKAAATRRARQEAKNEEWRESLNDRAAAVSLCRRIRDDENAADADRLKAIELLLELKER